MRSSWATGSVLGLALLAVAPAARGAEEAERGPVLALLPSREAAVTRALEEGAALALDEAARAGGPLVRLCVGEGGGPWGSVAASAVRLVTEEGAVALVTPPERALAHELAQVGTKAHVPVLTTSRAPSVTQAGSTWVLRVVARAGSSSAESAPEPPAPPEFDPRAPAAAAFVAAFRARHDRDPGAWEAAGYDAARAVALGLARRERGDARSLRDAMRALDVDGAAAPLRFDARGERVPAGSD